MKKMVFLLPLLFNLVTASVFAEGAEELKEARAIARQQKRMVILQNLQLTENEKQAFLPVYEQYQNARRFNNEALGRVIVDFAENYDEMSDAKALELLEQVLQIKQGRLDIKNAYLEKFKAVLPGKKVARYYQIENKLEALAEVKLAEIIPLLQ